MSESETKKRGDFLENLENVKTFYRLYKSSNGNCPLCKSELKHSHLGEFCETKKCTYMDGTAFLTDEQYEKFKHLTKQEPKKDYEG